MDADKDPGLYYHDYLQLDGLLALQELESAKHGKAVHDELLFITVHQAYELWFKQILWELDDVLRAFEGDVLDEDDQGRVVSRLQRIVAIQRLLLEQIDVLETMTPSTSSTSATTGAGVGVPVVAVPTDREQARCPPRDRLLFEAPYTHRLRPEHRAVVERAEKGPTLHDAVDAWLARTPFLDEYDFWDEYARAVRSMLDADREVIATNPNLGEDERAEQLRSFEKTIEQFEAAFDAQRHAEMVAAGSRRFSHRAFQGLCSSPSTGTSPPSRSPTG